MANTDQQISNPTEQPVSMGQSLELFQQLNTRPMENSNTSSTVTITEKLNQTNYTKWSRLMHLAISGRGKLKHIAANPPATDDLNFSK